MSIKGLEWRQLDPEKTKKIIEVLSGDPAMGATEISKKTGLGRNAVLLHLYGLKRQKKVVCKSIPAGKSRRLLWGMAPCLEVRS